MLFTVVFISGMRFAFERRQDQQALQASKDRLQAALNAARLGSWWYDPRQRVFSWDARSKEIFGVTEDWATVEGFMNWVHPDDGEKVWAAFHRALDPAQPARSPTQFQLRSGDGKVRWVETQGLAHLEGAGRDRQVVSFIGTVQDITERKEREEKVQLLMREINHRAKNMLSVVQAIAHQTASKNPEDFIERLMSAFRRFQPITTCSSATNGMVSRSRTWFAPSSRTSRTSSGPASLWTAPSCA